MDYNGSVGTYLNLLPSFCAPCRLVARRSNHPLMSHGHVIYLVWRVSLLWEHQRCLDGICVEEDGLIGQFWFVRYGNKTSSLFSSKRLNFRVKRPKHIGYLEDTTKNILAAYKHTSVCLRSLLQQVRHPCEEAEAVEFRPDHTNASRFKHEDLNIQPAVISEQESCMIL